MKDILNGKSFTVQPGCFPCFLRQTAIAVNLGTDDETLKMDIMKAVLADMENADVQESPAHATSLMHRRIRVMLGRDPFEHVKADYNRKALAMYPHFKKTVEESEDPLKTAAKLAIAGNIIDFGIFTSMDIEGTIERALNDPMAVDRYEWFRDEVDSVDEVLYLLDNAGEVVFDRLLIEELVRCGKRVVAVAKGSPIINDCTVKEAEEAGIHRVCDVIDNGSDAVGTILDTTSEHFRSRFHENGSLVISKGQGNFETLMNERRKIFFLLQSKCDVLSDFLGLPKDSMLLAGGSHEPA